MKPTLRNFFANPRTELCDIRQMLADINPDAEGAKIMEDQFITALMENNIQSLIYFLINLKMLLNEKD